MTKQEFFNLSSDQQESYINSGGLISADIVEIPAVTCQVEEVVSEFSTSQPDISIFDKIEIGPDKYDGLMIADPVDLLYLVDEEIQLGKANGGVDLEPWQIQIMLDFANANHTQDHPFQAVIRACNGSGKDKYIIASCAVWVSMRYKNTVSPITSSSGFQLKTQTCKHIKRLCEAVNRFFGIELWEIIERQYTFRFDKNDHEHDSQIVCYATDEPGKAEGFHPISKGARMALFQSEAKTIPDEINDAMNKCTGYTHRVEASTPGKSFGHFYDHCQMGISRKAIKDIKQVDPSDWIQYHITGAMCPYRGKNARKLAIINTPGGENSSAFKSQEDAEFGNDDGEMVCIPYTYVWQACRNITTPWLMEDFNTGGLDLSDGGDETALAVRNGNKLLKMIPFKFDNTQDTIDFLIQTFKDNGLNHAKSYIYGDCVGIGKPILDSLVRLGWKNIRYVDSRASAYNEKVYRNRNSEVWFHTRRLLEQRELILFQDKILEKQLGTRHYKLMDGKIHQMLSKIEEKKLGNPSPDRADAFNLAFWKYQSTYVESEVTEENAPFTLPEEKVDVRNDFDMRVWAKGQMNTNTRHSELEDLDDLKEELAQANKRRKQLEER